jgi:D-sedoheptulose 7-phosphate isomerase
MKHTISRKIDWRIEQLQRFKTAAGLSEAIALMEEALNRGNKVLVFGNGGSSTQSSHFAAELVNKFYKERPALAAIALTTDVANLTSIANDMDYKYIFSRQVEALGQPGDIALGLSTSGKSANVLEGLARAADMGLKTVALCGEHTPDLQNQGIHVIISIPSKDTPVIQEMHLFVLHMIAEFLEKSVAEQE